MVLREDVRFCAVACRLLTVDVKRFWMAPNWLWKVLTVASAESTAAIVELAPATVNTLALARVALPRAMVWPPAPKPTSAEPAPPMTMLFAADRLMVPLPTVCVPEAPIPAPVPVPPGPGVTRSGRGVSGPRGGHRT